MSDDLLKRLREIESRAKTRDSSMEDIRADSEVVQKRLTALHVFYLQIMRAIFWIYWNVVLPLGKVIRRPALWLFHQYRRLWDAVVYVKNRKGKEVFSPTRGGVLLLVSIVSLWYLPWPIMGFAWDISWYLATARVRETIYLTQSQEIYPDDDIHSVKACETAICDDQETFYFRVRPRTFNHFWAIAKKGDFFFPDLVSAAVPPGLNECIVSSYGIRAKFFIKHWDIYPDLLEARCIPVAEKKGIQ